MDSGERQIVLPGNPIDPAAIPSHKKHPLRLGPGLQLVPPQTILPTVAGQLVTDRRKNSLWVEYNGGKYHPSQGDLVIGQVTRSTGDHHHVQLAAHAPVALLPVLAFENATKKTRPQLPQGSLVYARVSLADPHMDAELECVDPSTGRAGGLGPLNGGMLFPVSLGLARRLLMSPEKGGVVVLDELGAAAGGLAFETAVGRNGAVWVGSESVKTIVVVGKAVRVVDEEGLGVAGQKRLVKRLLKEMA